jgi:hypothetical protein
MMHDLLEMLAPAIAMSVAFLLILVCPVLVLVAGLIWICS